MLPAVDDAWLPAVDALLAANLAMDARLFAMGPQLLAMDGGVCRTEASDGTVADRVMERCEAETCEAERCGAPGSDGAMESAG